MSDKAIWRPTCELRFVEKPVEVGADLKLLRVLQQKWEKIIPLVDERGFRHFSAEFGLTPLEIEWRDVPLESGS